MFHTPGIFDLAAIASMSDDAPLASINRAAYKYTSCGASAGFLIRHADGEETWVYDSQSLYSLGSLAQMSARGQSVIGVVVSSIIEGVDETTDSHELIGAALTSDAYFAVLGEVEEEASSIWNATHGCPKCAEHFDFVSEYGECEGDDGATPIWTECPECGGAGSCI